MRSLTTTKTKSIQEKQDSNHTDVQHSSKKLVSTKPVTERQDPNCPEALCLAKNTPKKHSRTIIPSRVKDLVVPKKVTPPEKRKEKECRGC